MSELTYTIIPTRVSEDLWQVDVQVLDGEDLIKSGQTLVSCETEEQAYEAVDRIYMRNLRANNPKTLGDLVLDWEIPEEPEEDPEEWDEEEEPEGDEHD